MTIQIVSVKQMQAIEKSADASGLSYEQMMNNAGHGIADWVYTHHKLDHGVIGLVGSGNNGGDTLIALKTLTDLGIRTIAFLVRERRNDPILLELERAGGSWVKYKHSEFFKILSASLTPGSVVLDGILGTGLRLPIRGELSDHMALIHDLVENSPGTRIIAVDCPSGLDCDTGECSEFTFQAEQTLCMAAIKQGLLRMPGQSFTGDLACIDIGISNLVDHISDQLPVMIDRSWVEKRIPERQETGHKGTFGTCLVVAGTKPYIGAAYLAGKAAYQAGCGLVNLATIPAVHRSLSGQLVEAVWTILPDMDDDYVTQGVDTLQNALPAVDALVIGPGWGLNYQQENLLRQFLPHIPKNMPTLIDADGLNLLRNISRWWEKLPDHSILTPHPGEMSILTGLDILEIQAQRWKRAQEYATKWQVTVVLKGALTIIAHPSGEVFIIPISDSALATAGSGDVLSGMIGGMLAQGWDCTVSAVIGAWMHANAGLIAKRQFGNNFSVSAVDILNAVPDVFSKLLGS